MWNEKWLIKNIVKNRDEKTENKKKTLKIKMNKKYECNKNKHKK